ncbi:DNA-damage-inducible protein J [Pseudobutyrivibrio sp. C4]|uniref:type II toxin-antitoxin system RelB/DinJ family antitoxin n=1 Tax=Pseudobutyrivibrio sp. C4 TaxID=1520803 RepID=UPI0008B81BAE|nr:type II toxin-antitoxin system RelB/DinJ family antitoxin [Pseudobutyrivibrio sp. C4]SET19243.1 DNA-damage-inducible protein J [Pseudobutyrivibrio sp. C4]
MADAVNVNFRMDADLKKSMEALCDELGMSMTTAFTIFAKKMTREHKIPFEVSVDPFYSEANIKYLEGIANDIKTGKAHFEQHDLLEDEE